MRTLSNVVPNYNNTNSKPYEIYSGQLQNYERGDGKVAKTVKDSGNTKRPRRAALTLEGRENQLISLAVDLVEKRLLEGTASSQEVTTILKLGTTKSRLENERLAKEVELVQAKIEAYKSGARMEELYQKAMKAFKRYRRCWQRDFWL